MIRVKEIADRDQFLLTPGLHNISGAGSHGVGAIVAEVHLFDRLDRARCQL